MVNQRHSFSEDELDKLTDLGTKFCHDLAIITAKVLSQFPEDIRDAVLMNLQDQTSLYSPYTADLIDATLKRKTT